VKNSVAGIAYRFVDENLLEEALTHRSRGAINYERLEFLGDSVLNLVVSSRLFELKPDAREGDLSRMRARLVRGESLADIASGLGLGKQLNLGEGEMKSGGSRRASILADALEALLGAIFLDSDYASCRRVILDLFDPLIEKLPATEDLKDAKTRLQEWLQGRGRPLPEYTLQRAEGAEHVKKFYMRCAVADDGATVEASGSSRRKAEQAAAAKMLELLQEVSAT
jgi:ribonuclease-3